MVFLSNLLSIVISGALLIVQYPKMPSTLAIVLHFISAGCSIVNLEFMHRIARTLHDHSIHIVFYLYIIFGVMADLLLNIRGPLFPTLLAALVVLGASHYPYNTEITTKAINILKHGSPQTLLQLDVGSTTN